MGLITVKHKGGFKNTERFFSRALREDYLKILDRYGQMGVQMLSDATPTESGETASRWGYEIEKGKGTVKLVFTNDHENQGVNIVILLMYGHGLQNGGFVSGNDFVHPTIQPLFQELANQAWREVTR